MTKIKPIKLKFIEDENQSNRMKKKKGNIYGIDQSLVCNTCNFLPENPTICYKCNTLFCRNCLENYVKEKQRCPKCLKLITNAALQNINLKNIYSKYKVKCPYNGCQEFLDLNQLIEHSKECVYKNIKNKNDVKHINKFVILSFEDDPYTKLYFSDYCVRKNKSDINYQNYSSVLNYDEFVDNFNGWVKGKINGEKCLDDIKKKINDFQIKKNINENEYLIENTINNKTNDNNNLIHHHLDKKLIFKNKKIKELTCKNLKDLINGEEDKKEEKIELKNVKKSLKNINSNLIPQNETIEGFQNEEHQIFQYKKPKKQKPILYSNYNENILYNIIHLEEQDDFLNTEITNNNSTITSLLNSNNNSINFSNTNSLCNSQSLSYKKNDNQSSIFRSNIQGENLNNNYYIEYNENEEEEEELEYDRKKDDEEIKYTNMIDNYETEQKNKIKEIKLENDHNQFNNYNHNFYDLNTNNDYVSSYEDFKFENKNNDHFKSRDIDKNINLFTEKNSKIKNNHNNHRYYDSIDNIDEDLKVQKDNNKLEEKK